MEDNLYEQINTLSLRDMFEYTPEDTPQRLFDAYLEKVKVPGTLISDKNIKWLCRHPLLTLSIIQCNRDVPWNMNLVSMNIAIPFDKIFECDDLEWNYDQLSMRSDLSSDIIENNITKSWNFWYISTTKLLTGKIIIAVPYLKHFAQIQVIDDLNYGTINKSLKGPMFTYDVPKKQKKLKEKLNN